VDQLGFTLSVIISLSKVVYPFDYKVTFLKIGVIIGVLAPINALFRIETPFNMPLRTSAKVGKPESFPKLPC
jgi:hypothetical protein